MKLLSYELAKQLQDAGFANFPQEEESLIVIDLEQTEKAYIIFMEDWRRYRALGYIWLPSFDDIMQDELMRGFIYEALPESLVYQPSKPYKDQIFFSGASAVEAAARAWLFLHDKKPEQV